MIPASEELRRTMAAKSPQYARRVMLYPREWDAVAEEYVFAAGIDITPDVLEAGPVIGKNDTEELNVWALGNITLTLRNDRQQYLEGNPLGRVEDEVLHGAKGIISLGATMEDGVTEFIPVFTGYVLDDLVFSPDEKTVDLELVSSLGRLGEVSAEGLSTSVVDELIGSDTGEEFVTTNVGVAPTDIIVKKGDTTGGPGAALELVVGADYTLADADTYGLPLRVTLEAELQAGQSLWISYKYWFTDKRIEWIVEELAKLAGLTEYDISTALFPKAAEANEQIESLADWSTSTIGDNAALRHNEAGESGVWQRWHCRIPPPGHKISSSSSRHRLLFPITFRKTVGFWCFALRPTIASNATMRVNLGTATSATYAGASPYYIRVYRPIVGPQIFFALCRNDGTRLGAQMTSSALLPNNVDTEVVVLRKPGGHWFFWVAGVPYNMPGGFTDNTSTDFPQISFFMEQSSGDLIFYNVYTGNSVDESHATDTYTTTHLTVPQSITPSMDMGEALDSYGKLEIIGDNGQHIVGGQNLFESWSSDTEDFSSGTDPAGWVSASTDGSPIASAVKRYLRIRITHPRSNPVQTADETWFAYVSRVRVYYYTGAAPVEFVRLTGMTVRQAIETLAKMCAYEIGFSSSDRFFFRPRTLAPSVMTLDKSNLISVSNLRPGLDRLYTTVDARFGEYSRRAQTDQTTRPNLVDQFGFRRYEVSSDSLLPAANVNLAFAVAPAVLEHTEQLRKRARVTVRLAPWLELGDSVVLTYPEPTHFKDWKWGDTDVRYGDTDIIYYDDEMVEKILALKNKRMRIEGIEHDLVGDMETTLDVVEHGGGE